MTSIITVSSNSRIRAVVTAAIMGIAFLLPGFSHAGPVRFQFVAEVFVLVVLQR